MRLDSVSLKLSVGMRLFLELKSENLDVWSGLNLFLINLMMVSLHQTVSLLYSFFILLQSEEFIFHNYPFHILSLTFDLHNFRPNNLFTSFDFFINYYYFSVILDGQITYSSFSFHSFIDMWKIVFQIPLNQTQIQHHDQISLKCLNHSKSKGSTFIDAWITIFINNSGVRPNSLKMVWMLVTISQGRVLSSGPGYVFLFQLKSGCKVVKNTPRSSTDPQRTAIYATSHFSVPFFLMQMATCEYLLGLLGSFFSYWAYRAWSGSLGGAYMTWANTFISCLPSNLEYQNMVFSSIYFTFHCLLLKYASLAASYHTILACESIIYLSSFFSNYLLVHFLEPQLYFTAPGQSSCTKEVVTDAIATFDMENSVDEDLFINMTIKNNIKYCQSIEAQICYNSLSINKRILIIFDKRYFLNALFSF